MGKNRSSDKLYTLQLFTGNGDVHFFKGTMKNIWGRMDLVYHYSFYRCVQYINATLKYMFIYILLITVLEKQISMLIACFDERSFLENALMK